MSSEWTKVKQAVVMAAQKMVSLELATGTSGNISARIHSQDELGDLLALTPSGKPYVTLVDDDIVVSDFEVEPIEGDLVPSTESLLHVAIYRARPDVQAVIHTHSIFASVTAVAGLEIPPIVDETTITLGGPIKISDYAFPGTQNLADNVCKALGERKAALIRNHGVVAVGRDLPEAVEICMHVERVAQIFVYASLLGKVNVLPPDIVEAEISIYEMLQPDGE